MTREISALVFDAYGTLFDVHSVTALAESLFPGKGAALSQAWRGKQLEYTWLLSLMGHYEDFNAVTARSLDWAIEALRIVAGRRGQAPRPCARHAHPTLTHCVAVRLTN